MNEVPPLEDSIEIEAPGNRIWDVISDIRRIAEWSPQVESTRLHGDHEVVELGTQFTNANRHGELTWKTHGTIVTFEPGHEAFMGGQEVFTETMRAGMRQTLWAIQKTLRAPPSH